MHLFPVHCRVAHAEVHDVSVIVTRCMHFPSCKATRFVYVLKVLCSFECFCSFQMLWHTYRMLLSDPVDVMSYMMLIHCSC